MLKLASQMFFLQLLMLEFLLVAENSAEKFNVSPLEKSDFPTGLLCEKDSDIVEGSQSVSIGGPTKVSLFYMKIKTKIRI